MDFPTFRRIIGTFADSPLDIDTSKGRLLAQIHGEVIEARLTQETGGIIVEEGDRRNTAERWLIERVAKVGLLASKLLSHIPDERHFVIPTGRLLDQPDFSERESTEDNALGACGKVLGRKIGGSSSILYLTSDAGEGKTTIINQLARIQAQEYLAKRADWLVLPVSLGGRPFMRFDEVVIAALVNRFRFQYWYFEGFVELVRMGMVVPAFDGFEEMFIENATGDAVSALGTLVQMLESSGGVLIAARKAYFDYSNLRSSARLFDALGQSSVVFARLSLDRWTRDQFLEYCQKRGLPDCEKIYEELSRRLGGNHPLITRAVLVKRLLDVAATAADRESLLAKFEANPHDYFSQFVDTILQREAKEKWISKSGDPPKPLLSVDEHYDLLSMLAVEMWEAGRSSVGADIVDTIARLFCEKKSMGASESRQVVDRLKQHALLIQEDAAKQVYAFDHEEFYHYFLGEALFVSLRTGSDSDLRALLRPRQLPNLTLEAAVSKVRNIKVPLEGLVRRIIAASQSDDPASFARENAGGLLVRLLDAQKHGPVEITGLSFPNSALDGRKLSGIKFVRCHFQQTALPDETRDCAFYSCDLERIRLESRQIIVNLVFEDCRIHAIQLSGSDTSIYDPDQIGAHLRTAKIRVQTEGKASTTADAVEPDEDLVIAERALRVFLRSTQISDYHLKNRLGTFAARFFREVLPALEKAKILEESDYHGAKKFKYYRLCFSMSRINDALENAQGSFKKFLERARAPEK